MSEPPAEPARPSAGEGGRSSDLAADPLHPAEPVGARRRATKVVAGWADRWRPPPSGVVVLIYHRVGRTSRMEVDLPRGLFADQMAWLAESGRVVTLDAALERLAGRATDEPDPVVHHLR